MTSLVCSILYSSNVSERCGLVAKFVLCSEWVSWGFLVWNLDPEIKMTGYRGFPQYHYIRILP